MANFFLKRRCVYPIVLLALYSLEHFRGVVLDPEIFYSIVGGILGIEGIVFNGKKKKEG